MYSFVCFFIFRHHTSTFVFPAIISFSLYRIMYCKAISPLVKYFFSKVSFMVLYVWYLWIACFLILVWIVNHVCKPVYIYRSQYVWLVHQLFFGNSRRFFLVSYTKDFGRITRFWGNDLATVLITAFCHKLLSLSLVVIQIYKEWINLQIDFEKYF